MKKIISILMTVFILVVLVGCGSGQKEFNALKQNASGDTPYTIDQNIEGKVVEINDNAKSITIAINQDKKYLFEVPEYSLGINNEKNGKYADGTYINKLPSFNIGDKVRVHAGTIQYIEPTKGNNRTAPYIIGQENLEIVKIE